MTPRDLRRVQVVARHYSTFRGGVTRAIWIPAVLLVGLFELLAQSRGPLPRNAAAADARVVDVG